jgi:hypothetical protein
MSQAAAATVDEPAPDRARVRSPGLAQFRKSPFRLLRLPLTATAQQAVWQCDKALARARVGMSLPDPDPLPWLPPGDELELQEAAQTMESPLARLVEQLLWFERPEVRAALAAADGAALRAALATAPATVADRVDHANLELLLGLSALRGVGPALTSAAAAPPAELRWRDHGGLRLVEDPHRAVAAAGALHKDLAWADQLGRALAGWGALLDDVDFEAHVVTKIEALGDELLGADDAEAVLAALRARLADLIVGETRLELGQGRLAAVAQLAALAGKSGLDHEVWLVAFRPLRAQFEAELAELQPEAATGKGEVEDVAAYLDRLGALAGRWRSLDDAQLLGLGALIDDAAGDALDRLKRSPATQQLEPRFREVLRRVGAVAISPSVRERIKAYEDRLTDYQGAMCHFCGKRELEASSCASLSSQRETSRTRYGNTTHIQYALGARPVGRCPRCAQVHDFILRAGHLLFGALAASVLVIGILHPRTWFTTVSTGAGLVLMAVGVGAAFLLGYLGRGIVARLITDRGDKRFDDYHGCRGEQGLRDDGFFSMKYDFRANAWELVNQQGVKARHSGGGGMEALKTIGYIGLFFALVGLRVCAGH